MFIRQQARQARFGHHFLKERLRDVAGQQPIAILGKVVASQTGSSMPSPTNHRNNTL